MPNLLIQKDLGLVYESKNVSGKETYGVNFNEDYEIIFIEDFHPNI